LSTPRSQITVGVDIGGTQVKLGIVRGRSILVEKGIPTRKLSRSPKYFVAALSREILDLVRQAKLKPVSVGVGIPGQVSFPEGMVQGCVNLKGWRRVPFKKQLESRLPWPVHLDNDVNVMTLGEWKFGAGLGADNLLCVTLGTGVGGGLVLQGQLHRGKRGAAGEIGHLSIDPAGRTCPCGGKGCLEQYIGSRQILAQARLGMAQGKGGQIKKLLDQNQGHFTHRLLDQAAARGDRLAQSIWAQAGERMGQVIALTINLLDIERVVVGGGIAKAGRWLFTPMRKSCRMHLMRDLKGVPILPAQLGVSAGLIGAGWLAQVKR